MCNLYNIKADPRTYFDALAAGDDASNTLEVEKDYAAPGKPGYVVRVEEGRRVLSTMRWGFPTRKPRKRPAREGELPFLYDWWTNARNMQSNMWKPWLMNAEHRCLVPFTRFSEPKAASDRKAPSDTNWWFSVEDQAVPCFAGLWKADQDHDRVYAFCTTEPNPLVAQAPQGDAGDPAGRRSGTLADRPGGGSAQLADSLSLAADERCLTMARNRYYDGPPSDHFDGTRFFNPGQPSTDRGLRAILRWKLAGAAAKWPNSVPVTPAKPEARVDGLCVTMVGHASLLIQAAGVNILTDPVWSERASPFRRVGPKRVTAPGIAFDDLPPIDVVLLSHAHYDHLDVDTLRRLQAAHDPLMAMPLGNDAVVTAAVPAARCVTGDWWDRLDLGNGITTTLTPANHWSNRWPSDTRMTLWSGHYLDTPAGAIWFVGDTGYGDGRIFGEVRERLGSPDLALIPIGAYAPRWFMSDQHVDPVDAVRIFNDVGATRALGIHWGTFQLTDEARDAPVEELATALRASRIAPEGFVAAQAGGVYRFA